MKNIALAFSGGGFRAAAFSLGTLSYLNELKFDEESLLKNVKFIGSASGGSLTNIYYSVGVYERKEFRNIYNELLTELEGEKLIKNVFTILRSSDEWKLREGKGRNLINAFSIAYDKLFKLEEFQRLFNPKIGVIPHLEEVCINSTELTNGLSFRFQSQKQSINNGKIGNYYIHITETTIGGKIKLGDIMASSSCFPGGLEPLIFPDDFVHSGLDKKTLLDSIYFKANPFTYSNDPHDILPDKEFKKEQKRFGLMDGGIADNQAIESVLLANQRRIDNSKDSFDLIILTDVSSYFMDGYSLPIEKIRWYNAFTLQQIINISTLLCLFFLGTFIWVIINGFSDWSRFTIIPIGTIAFFYLLFSILLSMERKEQLKKKVPGCLYFKNTLVIF